MEAVQELAERVIDRARAHGLDIQFDRYPYIADPAHLASTDAVLIGGRPQAPQAIELAGVNGVVVADAGRRSGATPGVALRA